MLSTLMLLLRPLLILTLLLALGGCDSDPLDTPPPTADDLLRAYGGEVEDLAPGTGLVHDGARPSRRGAFDVTATHSSFTEGQFSVLDIDLDGVRQALGLSASINGETEGTIESGEHAAGFFCCDGGGGGGLVVITEVADGPAGREIAGVFYADVRRDALFGTDPTRYSGGFRAVPQAE